MKLDKSKLRQQLRGIENSRSDCMGKIISEQGPLRRGAFVTVRRKCGKPNCHCAKGEGHCAKYLSVKESGRTRMIYIPDYLEVQVADEAKRYRCFRQMRARVGKLSQQSLAVIDELERALHATSEIDRRKKRNLRRKSTRKKS